MHPVLQALLRAVLSQLHVRMLLLTLLPFLLSVLLWGVILYFGLQPLFDWLQAWLHERGGSAYTGPLLQWLNMDAVRTVLVPLAAMWMLLPVMILTALIFVGTLAMPVIVRHVARRRFPELEARRGGTLWGTLRVSLRSFLIFIALWLLTLPLSFIPPLALIIQPALWGWLTYRVMAYDALAEHADADEYLLLMQRHRWPLLAIGIVAGLLGAAPTMLWLGGALAVILLPFMAAGAIWLYVLVFVFTSLWFAHYSLQALAELRSREPLPDPGQRLLSG